MMRHISFGHVETFDAVLGYAFSHPGRYPDEIRFSGTVKIHGSNCSVCEEGGERWYQSRKQIITKENDYFFAFAKERAAVFDRFFGLIRERHPEGGRPYAAAIYGEFFGEGIQKGVAVNKLPKSYAVFGAKLVFSDEEDPLWLPPEELKAFSEPSARIYSIYDFATYDLAVTADGAVGAKEAALLASQAVEDSCPVGLALGVSGPGEGIVWTHFATEAEPFFLRFKTKGRGATKTDEYNAGRMKEKSHRQPKPKEIPDFAKMKADVSEFLDAVLTDARIGQGLQEAGPEGFAKWLTADVMREERVAIAERKLHAGTLVAAIRERAGNILEARKDA